MPLHQNQDGTWQWGKSGKKYKKKQDAVKQMKAIFANGYVEKHASYFEKLNMPSYCEVLSMIKTAAPVVAGNTKTQFKKKPVRALPELFLKNGTQHFRIPGGLILSRDYERLSNYTGDPDYKTLLRRLYKYNPGFNPNKLREGGFLNLGLPAQKTYPTFDEAYEDMLFRQTGGQPDQFVHTKEKGINPKTGKPYKYSSANGPGQTTYARLLDARKLALTPEQRAFLEGRLLPSTGKYLTDPNYKGQTWSDQEKEWYRGITKKLFRKFSYDPAVAEFSTHGSQPAFYYRMAKGWHGNTINKNWKWANALRQRRLQINQQKAEAGRQRQQVQQAPPVK